MGLLIFKERSPDDKSPFKKNEFHVGKRPLVTAPEAASRTIEGRITRRRSPDRTTGSRAISEFERRYANRRRRARPSNTQTSPGPPSRYTHMLVSPSMIAGPVRSSTTNSSSEIRDASSRHADVMARSQEYIDRVEESLRRTRSSIDAVETTAENEDATSSQFAPARRYYEDLERHYFDVTPARERAQPSDSRSGSPDGNDRWRVTSPDTQQAIFRELRNQEDTENRSRLFVDGSVEISALAPRMTISQSDGLGNRRRSPSPAFDRSSDVEENWTDLMETIPVVDNNLPSAGSSFASDSASSILSRSQTRSSLTNTTNSDSRAGSTEVIQQIDHSVNCPDLTDTRPTSFSRSMRTTSSLAPIRYSPASAPRISQSRSANGRIDQQTLTRLSANAHQGLDCIDDLLEMIDSGMDVPPEMWAAVGISPHLALRGGGSRQRRRNERL